MNKKIKVVILAGGFGTRFSEETMNKPKPMIDIGGKPIIWHIMKYYSMFGINEFIICGGYKLNFLKEFFINYYVNNSDIEIDLKKNELTILKKQNNDWNVKIIDTGIHSMTGGRLKHISQYINSTFLMTYGDGLSDVDIDALIALHKKKNKKVTITAVRPPARFGALQIDLKNNSLEKFIEKPVGDNSYINGGFFVLEPSIFDYISHSTTIWEAEPMIKLTEEHQVSCFVHDGFFQPMDTLRDFNTLNNLWDNQKAPWKIW